MKRLAVLALTAVSALLSGCASYDTYDRYDDGYYADEYYGDHHYDRYYYDQYGNRVYYNHSYDVSQRYGYGYGYSYGAYAPDYIRYSSYYSVLWPTYRSYYDPYWSPGFYYGVTYYPRTYFGLNVGWYSWPYYQAYAPYRYSYADHYYDWWDERSRDGARDMQWRGRYPRYGSARNEALYLQRATGARSAAQSYYGYSAQPGSLMDPDLARQTRARGGVTSFDRTRRTWDTEPYGPDGRGYGGFTGSGLNQPSGRDSRMGRTIDPSVRTMEPNRAGFDGARSSRGYDRNPDRYDQRQDGLVTPAPESRMIDRSGGFHDSRIDATQESVPTQTRVYGGRARPGLDRGGDFQPRQVREPYNPVFERHVDETPQPQAESQYPMRGRGGDRNRGFDAQPAFEPQPAQPRNEWRQYERSAPAFERSEPREQPRFERAEPRDFQRFERSEPQEQPRFERAEPRFERPEPSFTPPSSQGFGRSSDDEGSSRGQLERIIRDDR